MYWHPDREIYRTGFKLAYDYYALGVILFEIALWQPLPVLLAKHPWQGKFSEYLINKAQSDDFKSQMGGGRYMEATLSCLKSEFDSEEGNVEERFQTLVVVKLNSVIV